MVFDMPLEEKIDLFNWASSRRAMLHYVEDNKFGICLCLISMYDNYFVGEGLSYLPAINDCKYKIELYEKMLGKEN